MKTVFSIIGYSIIFVFMFRFAEWFESPRNFSFFKKIKDTGFCRCPLAVSGTRGFAARVCFANYPIVSPSTLCLRQTVSRWTMGFESPRNFSFFKKIKDTGFCRCPLVSYRGFEPRTPCLKGRCSAY